MIFTHRHTFVSFDCNRVLIRSFIHSFVGLAFRFSPIESVKNSGSDLSGSEGVMCGQLLGSIKMEDRIGPPSDFPNRKNAPLQLIQ